MNTMSGILKARTRFHHIGLLTRDEGQAVQLLQALGYEVGEPVVDPVQNATLRMACGPEGNPDIEIIVPSPENSGLWQLLKRRDDYMYHLCYTTDDRTGIIESLAIAGATVHEISPPKEASLFGGRAVSFYAVAGLGLIEFLED